MSPCRGDSIVTCVLTVAIQVKQRVGRVTFPVRQCDSDALLTAKVQREEVSKSLDAAAVAIENGTLRSPIAGRVQELAITTVGHVLHPGQKLMTVVPSDAELEAEALITNADVGFVMAGQRAILKIDNYPYGRYGYVSGVISNVSRQAIRTIPEESSREEAFGAMEADAVNWAEWKYAASIKLDAADLVGDQQRPVLLPGMSAQAEIKIGKRRIIEYVPPVRGNPHLFSAEPREVASEPAISTRPSRMLITAAI